MLKWSHHDERNDRTLGKLQGHTSSVYSAAFSSDGKKAVTGSYDTIARIWFLE
jgi:WD40 repeat protein